MTSEQINQNQIIEEINLIPEDKRKQLYDLIHKFRISLERSHNNIDEIMQFAGSWLDMSEEDFSDFCEEIEQRRQASSSLKLDETLSEPKTFYAKSCIFRATNYLTSRQAHAQIHEYLL